MWLKIKWYFNFLNWPDVRKLSMHNENVSEYLHRGKTQVLYNSKRISRSADCAWRLYFSLSSLPGSKAYSSNLGSNTVIFSSSHYVTTLYRVLRGISPSFLGTQHLLLYFEGDLFHSLPFQILIDRTRPRWILDILKNWHYNHWGDIKVFFMIPRWENCNFTLGKYKFRTSSSFFFKYHRSSGSKYLGQSCSG